MEEDIKGKFVERTSKDGIRYAIYVPENVNEDTPIFTYVHGSGGAAGDWRNSQNGVLDHGSDSIIIMPTMNWNADWGTNTMNIVNEVKEEYGITNTNVSSSGFSMGGFAGYVTVAENIRQNPDCDPQIVYYIDDYASKTYYNYKNAIADEETMQLFKDNQTVFFVLEGQYKGGQATTAYAEAGLNVIRVVCHDSGHVEINKDFFYNGIYDYMAGGTLPSEGYTYQMYNSETGKWENIAYEDIATIQDLYSYYNIDTFVSNMDRLYSLQDITIKSDDKTLESYINSIRASLRNTTFLTANFNDAAYLSTTQVPNGIPEIVNAYFSMTSSLLNSIANKTTAIAKIAGEIEFVDKEMASRAEQLNNSTALYCVSSYVPETTTPQEPSTEAIVTATEPTTETENTTVVPVVPVTKEETTTEPTTTPSTEQTTTPATTPANNGTSNNNNSTNNNTNNNTNTSNNNNTNKTETTEPTQTTEPATEVSIEEYFPEYDELYSTDNKIVYNYNDEYKVVVHYEGDQVTAIEHYYDFTTAEDATAAVEQLQLEYQNNENFDQIIQNDRYVKVLFKEDMYSEMTLTEIKEQYIDLEEVTEKIEEL